MEEGQVDFVAFAASISPFWGVLFAIAIHGLFCGAV